MNDLTELLDQFDAFKKEQDVDTFAKPTDQKGWRDNRATELFKNIKHMESLVIRETNEQPSAITTTRKKVSSFNLVFRKLDKRIRKRYEIKDNTKAIELVINLNNPIFEEQFAHVDEITDVKTVDGLVILCEIFIDSFAKLLADREISSNDHVKTLDSMDLLKYAESIHQGFKVQLDIPMYKMFNKYINAL